MSDIDAAAATGGETIALSQKGASSAFLVLSVKNGLLNLITLTLYRFWGKTEVRRRLWATTYLNDEAFEYTGRGVELFVGFLLALLVIVLPFLCVIFGVQFLGPAVALLILPPFYLFIFFIAGFGRFTAFRYLATRSAWRGVRFHMRGSATRFGFLWLGYMLLSGISLGWFWPAADRRLAGRLWGGLCFGDRDFEFSIEDARKEPVYGAYTLSWVLGVIGYFVFVGIVVGQVASRMKAGGAPTPPTLQQMVVIYAASFALILLYAVAFAPFRAAMLRSIVAGIGLGEVRFKLKLGWFELVGISLTNILLATFSLGLLLPFIEARTRKFLLDRLESTGAVDLAAIRQNETTRPRSAEGIADAFGFSAI